MTDKKRGEAEMVKKRNRRSAFLGAVIGAVSLFCVQVQAQVYSDADTVRAVQEKLNEAGFDCGTADGIAGSRTAEAIAAWQNENQLTPSGEIDDALLASMGLPAAGTEENGPDAQSTAAPETEAAAGGSGNAAEGSENAAEVTENPAEAAETAAEASENAAEAPSDPVEEIEIEGTVIYNAHRVAVTAALSQDGKAVEYRVQNASEYPVVVMPGDLVANEVSLETVPDPYFYMMQLRTCLMFALDGEFSESDETLYVNAGTIKDITIEVDSDLSDIFSYEKVSKLETSVGVIGLSEELLLDGTDEFEEEDALFTDAGTLTEVEIPDAAWDGVWTEVEGTVLYEDDQVRLIDLGLMRAVNGSCYFGMVLENHSQDIVSLDYGYDSAAVLNGEAVEYRYCYGKALPGTRTYGYLRLELEGIDETSEITNAYCPLEILGGYYETLAEVEYLFGSEEDRNAAKERSEEAAAESEAAAQEQSEAAMAEEQALLGFTVEEQTIYDSDGFVIKAIGAGQNWNGALKLYLEVTNNTDTDATVSFSSVDGQVMGEDDYIYINGFQVSGGAYIDVAAKETVTDAVFLDTYALEAAGIENIGEIEVQFSIYDENFDPIVPITPSVIRTSAYEEMDTELGEDMQNVYSGNGFTLYAKYVEATADAPAYIACALRNDSGEAAGFHIDDLKINGIEDEDFYHWNYELAGRTWLRGLTINQDFLAANGIDQIESLSICLNVSGPQRGNLTPLFKVSDISVPLG